MSKDLNHCSFIGRLGRDPEAKYAASGNAIANFSIACGDDYKNKDGQKVEQTNWITIVAFGKLAEIINQYLKKGSLVYISGKQVTRKWQDKDNNDRYSTEIVANEMQMLSPKTEQSQASQGRSAAPQAAPRPPIDDDVPF